MKRVHGISLCLAVALLISSSGCSLSKPAGWKLAKNWDVRRAMGLKQDEPEEPQVPTRLVSTWTDTVLRKQGQTPQRGFGGRLIFFNNDSEKAIRVDGQLVVYAYDEADAELKNTQPSRRYIFPREQFVRHESESKLGPSYSVWLPWDESGGERKNISLIARFESHEGQFIVGEQTRHLLPGREPVFAESSQSTTRKIPSGKDVRLAQHTSATTSDEKVVSAAAVEATNEPRKRMTSTSIPLSKNWKRRLALQTENPIELQQESTSSTEVAREKALPESPQP